MRLPRTVHNQGTGGFAGLLTDIARRTGESGFPCDGAQRWPAVHALDAAVLFRLVLEQAEAGTSWHAVDDEGDEVPKYPGLLADLENIQARSQGIAWSAGVWPARRQPNAAEPLRPGGRPVLPRTRVA